MPNKHFKWIFCPGYVLRLARTRIHTDPKTSTVVEDFGHLSFEGYCVGEVELIACSLHFSLWINFSSSNSFNVFFLLLTGINKVSPNGKKEEFILKNEWIQAYGTNKGKGAVKLTDKVMGFSRNHVFKISPRVSLETNEQIGLPFYTSSGNWSLQRKPEQHCNNFTKIPCSRLSK